MVACEDGFVGVICFCLFALISATPLTPGCVLLADKGLRISTPDLETPPFPPAVSPLATLSCFSLSFAASASSLAFRMAFSFSIAIASCKAALWAAFSIASVFVIPVF